MAADDLEIHGTRVSSIIVLTECARNTPASAPKTGIQARKCQGSYDMLLAHYSDVIISATASQITGVSIVYSTICSGADQWNHQSSASLAFVRWIHRWPVNSPHKGPVTRKKIPFDDVIMTWHQVLVLVYFHKFVSIPPQIVLQL